MREKDGRRNTELQNDQPSNRATGFALAGFAGILAESVADQNHFNHMGKLFLGLDSSTQSLSAVVIDLDARKVIYEKSLNFDQSLPHYKTRNGVLPNRDPLVKHSPPLMWAEALDLMFATMKRDGVALEKILAVGGSGQQHGSVYLNEKAADALANL